MIYAACRTPYPMRYYDIHTHRPAIHPEDMAIISIDIRKPFIPCALMYSAGVHPWYIDYDDKGTTGRLFEKVHEYAQLPAVIAIGEAGLDKMTAKTTNDYLSQQTLFISHAHLAEEVKKPLIIHCVRAWNELLRIQLSFQPAVPWVVHGFRGKESLASRLLDAGFYLSFGLHYNIISLQEAWTYHRLLVETDDNQINIRDVYHQIANDLLLPEQELVLEIEKRLKDMNMHIDNPMPAAPFQHKDTGNTAFHKEEMS